MDFILARVERIREYGIDWVTKRGDEERKDSMAPHDAAFADALTNAIKDIVGEEEQMTAQQLHEAILQAADVVVKRYSQFKRLIFDPVNYPLVLKHFNVPCPEGLIAEILEENLDLGVAYRIAADLWNIDPKSIEARNIEYYGITKSEDQLFNLLVMDQSHESWPQDLLDRLVNTQNQDKEMFLESRVEIVIQWIKDSRKARLELYGNL